MARSWTALIPLKRGADRKSRLAGCLSTAQRAELAEDMFGHVYRILSHCPEIREIALLSTAAHPGWQGSFVQDLGRGLNEELEAATRQLQADGLLVIHADLPCLQASDITAILKGGAATGFALAPDKTGSGTNAIALRPPDGFRFQFGADSFARHIEASGAAASVIRRLGLEWDIDTPEDLLRLSGNASASAIVPI